MAKATDKRIIEAARVHFMTTGENLIETAKHFGLSIHCLRGHAQKGGWNSTKGKIQSTIENANELVTHRSIEALSKRVEDRVSSHLEAMIEGSMKLRKDLMVNLLEQKSLPPILKHDELESGVRTLQRLDQISRLSMNLPSTVEHVQVSGQVDHTHTLSILESCRKLQDEGKGGPEIDVEALLVQAKEADGK